VTSARGLTFTTTVRVIDGVHRNTAVGGTNTLPAVATSLADRDVLVVSVANLADGRHALDKNPAGLARRQLEKSVVTFFGDQVDLGSGGASHLCTLTGTKLDVMHNRSRRDELQRQRIADEDIGLRPAHDRLTDSETNRLNDVALLAVRVVDQRDAGAAVRIVLDRRNSSGDPELVALEVNKAQLLLVTATVVTHRKAAVVVAAAGALLDSEQRLMRLVCRDVIVDKLRREAE